MGLPGFFSWLLKKYTRNVIMTSELNIQIDELYIDANCMLHPSCFKILNSSVQYNNVCELEAAMIEVCITDLDYIIKYVNPKYKLYVAVDGVAPLAKINQQRRRRYKSYDENMIKNKIREKFGVKQNTQWSNASITPGTIFMEKLHNRLLEYLKTLTNPIKIIYSSYHTVGEGEHKIFDYIRNNPNTANKVVYGLDADLIFLAMASNQKNIYLIRENNDQQTINVPNQYNYVIIDTLVQCFNEHVKTCIKQAIYNLGIDVNISVDITNDIIFICYLLGNDFLPHVPTIDIRKSGLDMILNAYVIVFTKYLTPLIRDTKVIDIDVVFFDEFMYNLSQMERERMETHKIIEQNERQQIEPHFDKPIDREFWRLDNMKIVKSHNIYNFDIGTFDDWKFGYYEYHFGCNEGQETTIKDVCKNYLDGILWITKYYFGCCPSWEWTYNYSHAPFVTDLSKFIKTQHYDINNIHFDMGCPIPATVQLLCVIPPSYSHLLPKQYKILIDPDNLIIGDMFPLEFELDTSNKDMFWQCIPILPHLDLQRVILECNKIPDTEEVKKLNAQFHDINIH